ncbi:triosephosphate isomerase [Aureococcus anophagefferens]|nr:triosephosphate isomerase [Aureococcus anophagefferens]
MNPTSLADAKELATVVAAETADMPGEAIIFRPARQRPGAAGSLDPQVPFIGAVSEIIKDTKLHLGAQSCFFEDSGAYTRRGVDGQLAKDLAGVSAEDMKKIVIAYEPVPRRVRRPGAFLRPRASGVALAQVWAIGTGLVCPSDKAQEVHKFIRSKLASMYDEATADAVRIQYGGSVTPDSGHRLSQPLKFASSSPPVFGLSSISSASRCDARSRTGSQYHENTKVSTNKNPASLAVISPSLAFSSWSSKAVWPSMIAVTMQVKATHCAVA